MKRVGALLAALAVLVVVGGSSMPAPAAAAAVGAASESSVAPDGPKDCVLDPVGCVKDLGDKAGEIKDGACEKLNLTSVCDKVDDVAGGVGDTVSAPLKGLQASIDALTSALDNIAAFNPKNIAESWAKSGAEATVWVLNRIQDLTTEVAEPAYKLDWWGKQYAITFALGLIIFAFMLVFIGAKIGGSDGPVSGITLAREVAGRLPWVVPMMVIAPAVMTFTQPALAGFAEALGKEGNKESGSAADAFIELMAKAPADGGYFTALGGGLMAMVMLFLGAGLGLIVMVELIFSQWGSNFFGLLVPMAVALWIYPPWRKVLSRLISFLLGLWLIPFAVNLVYWSMWGAAAGLGDDILKTTLYLIVSLFMLVAAPILAPMVLRKLVPDHEGPSAGHGSTSSSSSSSLRSQGERYREMQSRRSSSEPGSDAGSASGAGGPGAGKTGIGRPAPSGGPAPGGSGAAPTAGAPGGGPAAGPGAAGAAGSAGGGTAAGSASAGGSAAGGSAAGATSAGASGAAAVGGSAAAGPAAPVVAAAAVAAMVGKKMRDEARQSRTRYMRD